MVADPCEHLKVIICRQPGDGHTGEIAVAEISGIRWDAISGGVRSRQGAYHLYGYIPYDMAKKLVSCSGTHSKFKGAAKICICKRHNTGEHRKGYQALAEEAGAKPRSIISVSRPQGAPPCTKKVLHLLSDKPPTRGELRTMLIQMGYKSSTILGAIRTLHEQQKITFSGSSNSPKQIISYTIAKK